MYPFNRYPQIAVPCLSLVFTVLLWRVGAAADSVFMFMPALFIVTGAALSPWLLHLVLFGTIATRNGSPLLFQVPRYLLAVVGALVAFSLAAFLTADQLEQSFMAVVALLFPVLPLFVAAAVSLAARHSWPLRPPGAIAPRRRSVYFPVKISPASLVQSDSLYFEAPPAQLGEVLYAECDMLESDAETDRGDALYLTIAFIFIYCACAAVTGGLYESLWRCGLVAFWSSLAAIAGVLPYVGWLRRSYCLNYVCINGGVRFSCRDGEKPVTDELVVFSQLAAASFLASSGRMTACLLRLDAEKPLCVTYPRSSATFAVALASGWYAYDLARHRHELERHGHTSFYYHPDQTVVLVNTRLELQRTCSGQNSLRFEFNQCHFEEDGDTLLVTQHSGKDAGGQTGLELKPLYGRAVLMVLLRERLEQVLPH